MKKAIMILTIATLCMTQIACSNNANQETTGAITETSLTTETTEATEATEATETTTSTSDNESTSNDSITENNIDALIPEGWKIFEKVEGEPAQVEGDLNKDGISDVAVVIVATDENEATQAPQRALLIALGNSDDTYTLSIIGEKAILRADEGGVWGDPFDSIEIDRGSIVINFYGGSNWRWYQHYRFRYQDDGWYLIGATLGSYFNAVTTEENADEDDYNLLTGDFISKKTDEKGNQTITKGNRGINPLLNLKDFIADSLAIEKLF